MTAPEAAVVAADEVEELAADGLRWLTAAVRETADANLAWTTKPEPISYGWCHGPAGDAQVFRLLRHITAAPVWPALADRCRHTVTHSGPAPAATPRVLGQQRPLLRHRGRPRPGLRPDR